MFQSPLKAFASLFIILMLWLVSDAALQITETAEHRPGFANALVVLCFLAVAGSLWHANCRFGEQDENSF